MPRLFALAACAIRSTCDSAGDGEILNATAAPLAALLKERDRMGDKRVGLILSRSNIDLTLVMAVMHPAAEAPFSPTSHRKPKEPYRS